jgi:hypothetical protein
MSQISDLGSSMPALIGHVLPLAVLAVIVALIVARRMRMTLRMPTIAFPRLRPRRKRVPSLRLVKGTAMDDQLAELLRSERKRDGRN